MEESFQIIDFHVHPPLDAEEKGVNPQSIAEELLNLMDKSGISKAVILPIAPYISNNYIYRIVEVEPRRLVGFASVVPNPADRAVKELERAVSDLGLRGLKLHPGMQGFCLRSTHVWKVLRRAGELGIPVIIHALWMDESSLYFKSPYKPWENPLEDYALLPYIAPETRLIYAHMGGLLHFKEVFNIATHRNVYLDTSYSIITITREVGLERLAHYIKLLGAEKVLFGSDTVPGLTPEDLGPKKQIELINRFPLGEEEKEKILFKNAQKLLETPKS
jgi:predicted TIM-barrel fold metal-dependent hydrolase